MYVVLVVLDTDDPHFNAIFSGDFKGDYENVMNRGVDHINYGGYEHTVMTKITTTTTMTTMMTMMQISYGENLM